jgi:hypothetical protein
MNPSSKRILSLNSAYQAHSQQRQILSMASHVYTASQLIASCLSVAGGYMYSKTTPLLTASARSLSCISNRRFCSAKTPVWLIYPPNTRRAAGSMQLCNSVLQVPEPLRSHTSSTLAQPTAPI